VCCCLDFFPALWILQVGTISWYFLTLIFNQYFFFKKDVSRSRNDTAVSAVLLHMLVVRTLMAGIISCGLACTELISVLYEFGLGLDLIIRACLFPSHIIESRLWSKGIMVK
jgi:membrane protein CcdC involved in cytochrome C biogenesis